jgi:D-alanine-D-alanine ligase
LAARRRTGEKLRVAVLFGGRSAEHEISILSARNIVEALDRDRFEPVLVGIDKEGRWLVQEEAMLLGQSRDPRLVRLNQEMPEASIAPHQSAETTLQVAAGAPLAVDVVFPVLHGPMGEDGSVQGLLTLAGVPFVGAGIAGSAVGMDKDLMKRLLAEAGIPIVAHRVVRAARWARARQTVIEELGVLGSPSFAKPANMGSSVGVSRATTPAELEVAIDHAFEFDDKVVVEAGVPGLRELECAVLGNDEPAASRVGEIVVSHADGFYSYDAKYVDEHGATTVIPADITEDETRAVQALAIRTFGALECAGLARVDFFRAQSGALYVNEVNTLPGFTNISMYPKLWEASGVPQRELVSRLIDLALERAERRRKLRTSR